MKSKECDKCGREWEKCGKVQKRAEKCVYGSHKNQRKEVFPCNRIIPTYSRIPQYHYHKRRLSPLGKIVDDDACRLTGLGRKLKTEDSPPFFLHDETHSMGHAASF